MADRFGSFAASLDSPAANGFSFQPDDNVIFDYVTRGIYVGTSGNVRVNMQTYSSANNLTGVTPNTYLTFVNVPAGVTLAVRAKGVQATGTTANNMIGLY